MKQKILKGFRLIQSSPLEMIELILTATIALFGLYLMSPFYLATPGALFSVVIDNQIYRTIVGVFLVVPVFPIIFWQLKEGIIDYNRKQKQRKFLLLYVGVCYLYLTILRLIAIGPQPVYWMYTLSLFLIATILYLRLIY